MEVVQDFQDVQLDVVVLEVLAGLDFEEGDQVVVDHQRHARRVFDEVLEDFEQHARHLLATGLLDHGRDVPEEARLVSLTEGVAVYATNFSS